MSEYWRKDVESIMATVTTTPNYDGTPDTLAAAFPAQAGYYKLPRCVRGYGVDAERAKAALRARVRYELIQAQPPSPPSLRYSDGSARSRGNGR